MSILSTSLLQPVATFSNQTLTYNSSTYSQFQLKAVELFDLVHCGREIIGPLQFSNNKSCRWWENGSSSVKFPVLALKRCVQFVLLLFQTVILKTSGVITYFQDKTASTCTGNCFRDGACIRKWLKIHKSNHAYVKECSNRHRFNHAPVMFNLTLKFQQIHFHESGEIMLDWWDDIHLCNYRKIYKSKT